MRSLLLGMLPFIGFATFIAPGRTDGRLRRRPFPLLLVYGVLVPVIRVVGAKLPDQPPWTRASSTALSVLAVGGLLLGLWSGAQGVAGSVVALAIGMSLPVPGPVRQRNGRRARSERGQAVGTFSLSFDPGEAGSDPVLGVVVALADYRAAFVVAGLRIRCRTRIAVGPVARRAAASAPRQADRTACVAPP